MKARLKLAATMLRFNLWRLTRIRRAGERIKAKGEYWRTKLREWGDRGQ
jgi:hypothetical protein